MARRMLINAQHGEEIRIAVAENDKLLDLEIERADQVQLKGNVYKSRITRIEPSLQAAFLDIGSSRNGFLQINDINPTYFSNWPPEERSGRLPRPAIQDVLQSGQDLIVQVVKDERAAKGATLTTNLSIPGRYLVLMIGNQRGGVSRKISDEGQRTRLRGAVRDLRVPPGMGVIVRTAGISKSSSQLQADLDSLLETWAQIVAGMQQPGAPILLYQESDLSIRSIRDFLTQDIDEILIDDAETYEKVKQFIERTIPNYMSRLKFYSDKLPLFTAYHLDSQVEEIDHPEVILPSGGSIVINVTEAVVAVDVNSGRSTGQSDVEETAFATNKEAAQAIAKHLRLRDLGGLIVIDFIDMNDRRHKQSVERVLRDAVSVDKAKVEIGRISKFGLLEMSRQRLKSSLVSQSHSICPNCVGHGRVKTPESAAIDALRKIQSAAFAGGVEEIRVHMSPAAALLLLNEKRSLLTSIEQESGTRIFVFADGRMKPSEYKFELKTGKQLNELEHRVTASRAQQTDNRSERDNRGRGGQQRDRSRGRFPENRDGRHSQNRNSRRNHRDGQGADNRGGEFSSGGGGGGGRSDSRRSRNRQRRRGGDRRRGPNLPRSAEVNNEPGARENSAPTPGPEKGE